MSELVAERLHHSPRTHRRGSLVHLLPVSLQQSFRVAARPVRHLLIGRWCEAAGRYLATCTLD